MLIFFTYNHITFLQNYLLLTSILNNNLYNYHKLDSYFFVTVKWIGVGAGRESIIAI